MTEEMKEKIRIKKWEINNWVQDKVWRAKMFANQHEEAIIILGPAVLGIGGKLVTSATRQSRIRGEKNLKERFMYDRRLGGYLEMRRKPTQNEYLEIDRRRRNGESLPQILSSMKLLK